MGFRAITEQFWVAPQIGMDDIASAAAQGIALIINNRPDGEEPEQPSGAEIATAALAAGLAYAAIPVTQAGFSQPQVAAMVKAISTATGPVLAYCRSGTRSTLLWALAEASQGGDPDALTNLAAKAGYDINSVRPLLDMLKAQTPSASQA